MTEQELKDVFRRKYYRTSSFTSGVSLMITDAVFVMLSIGASFFIINLINYHWINFRSFVEYAAYQPPTLVVFYGSKSQNQCSSRWNHRKNNNRRHLALE